MAQRVIIYRKKRCGDLPIDAVACMCNVDNVIAALRGLMRTLHVRLPRSTLFALDGVFFFLVVVVICVVST